jgi:uncharacterized protein
MKQMRNASLLLMFVLLCSFLLVQAAAAFDGTRSGHVVLLTVAEENQPLVPERGGTADLYLELRPGTGRIFVDTYPWTKLDTQSSIRFANQVACSYTGEDCSQHDFFYTIRADSVIVGGPSAGAAIAVLTAALLEGKHVNESIAVTGTINSGGIIGPVAGVRAKALAAKERSLSLVLISSFSYPTELNESYLASLNITDQGLLNETDALNFSRIYVASNLSGLGIEVREVSTLAEALGAFTGTRPGAEPPRPLVEDPAYTAIMEDVAGQLCQRRDTLAGQLPGSNVTADANATRRQAEARQRKDWYTLASYCFGDLVQLRGEQYEPLGQPQRNLLYTALAKQLSLMERNLDARNLTTLAQLETYMIVNERLDEAKQTLQAENLSNLTSEGLGFVAERLHSADVWSAFFQMRSPELALPESRLAAACAAKRVEAEERINYVEFYLPEHYLQDAQQELTAAEGYEGEGKYAVCLFRAAKAQADADLLAGALSVPKEKVDSLVVQKLAAVEQVIAKQEARGLFPILGYSYYRYSQGLREHDPYSALTFAEYSLEFSNLDLYFPSERKVSLPTEDIYIAILFASGLLLGAIIGVIITRAALRKKGLNASGKRTTVKKGRSRK